MRTKNPTDCFVLQDIFNRPLHVKYDRRRVSSDGGALLLAAADRKLGLTKQLGKALPDRRTAGKIQHTYDALLKQRIYGIACGYADASDASRLNGDPVHGLISRGDSNATLASQPTLSRFENYVSAKDCVRLASSLADRVLDHHRHRLRGRARRITLDLDGTHDPTHGAQQLTFFNGFYDCHCYQPLLGFLTFNDEPEQYLFAAILRPGNASARLGAVGLLRRSLARIQAAFPDASILVRLDGGFACEEIFALLESCKNVYYAVNFAKNQKIIKRVVTSLKQARRLAKRRRRSAAVYGETRYKAGKWSCIRRVIFKAELSYCDGREPRENPRFVVTNLPQSPRHIYRKIYCARGDSENRIKELKDSLALDRLSCCGFFANQFRLLLSAAAFVLIQEIRRNAIQTGFARSQTATIILRLFKISAEVVTSVRRILVRLPTHYPDRKAWECIAAALAA